MKVGTPSCRGRTEPILTVVIPAYNVSSFIGRTLTSVMHQPGPVEVIVVNDGSTDQTARVVKDILSQFQHGSYRLVNQTNAGVSAARNTGLAMARGEYVLFLDGDDYISEALLGTLSRVAPGRPDIICWAWDVVNEDEQLITRATPRNRRRVQSTTGLEALEAAICTRTLPLWTASAAYRADFLRRRDIAFTQGCQHGEDREFQYRALAAAERVTVIPCVLSFYTQRDDSLSISRSLATLDSFYARRRAADYIARIQPAAGRSIAEQVLLDAANNHLRDLRQFAARNMLSMPTAVRRTQTAHPELAHDVRSVIRKLMKSNLPISLSLRIYNISPILYARLEQLRGSWNLRFGQRRSRPAMRSE